jgi:hypothetical protein
VDFLPSFDEDIWLVRTVTDDRSEALFRFSPEQSTWTLLFQNDRFGVSISNIVWSPDGHRVAFTESLDGNPAPSLLVAEADGSHLWDLGYFPNYEYLAWGKCGCLRTMLLGREE